MKIESVDFFYLSMPEVLDVGDGSQDSVLVRVRAGGLEGWGECEASPLATIAAYVAPMSHSACKPVSHSLEGMNLNDSSDIITLSKRVHQNSFDLLQADHTLSGIDIALWDLLGKYLEEPVYKLLGYKKAYPKLPYASQLFGDTPELTFEKAKFSSQAGYKATKFGWGPIGKSDAATDGLHFEAARAGVGNDHYLMVDIGTVWNEDVNAAKQRLEKLNKVNVHWLEEPFSNMALHPYKTLSDALPKVPLAAGEGCNNFLQAAAMLDYAGLQYIQIDTGRIGGITAAKRVADLAAQKGTTYVNHTFTSHLALSSSLQPYAGLEKNRICEYPVDPKLLALEMTNEKILPDENGEIILPDRVGLGLTVNTEAMKKYLVDVEITVNGKKQYETPKF
ncbi:MAG: mandelate racemase/muconate lactonizing enzyme family protein [Pedobacter sp.]|nr:MAG: mandelate racemase/muconate lactonizing enzyme family protein [Pedobacter sp.]